MCEREKKTKTKNNIRENKIWRKKFKQNYYYLVNGTIYEVK